MRPLTLLAALLLAATAARAQTYTGALDTEDAPLDDGTVLDEYTVEVGPGQTLTADLTSPDFDPYLIAVAPSGEAFENDDWDGRLDRSRLVIPDAEAGAWRVGVTHFWADQTGAYTLTLSTGEAETTATDAEENPAFDWSAAFDAASAYLDSLGVAEFDENLAYISEQIRIHHPWRSGLAFDAGARAFLMDDEMMGTVRIPIDRIEAHEEDAAAALRCVGGAECIRVEGPLGGFTTTLWTVVFIEGATEPQPIIVEVAERLRSVLRHATRSTEDRADP